MTITVILPWPASQLSPNGRSHWRNKAAAVKQARMDAGFLALEAARGSKLPPGAPLEVSWLFCRPTMRKHDLDNLIGRCKAYQDGLADALGFNDAQVRKVSGAWGEVCPGGKVELRLDVLPR